MLVIFFQIITNTLKIMIKIKNCQTFNTGMQIIYMVEQCHKCFQWITLSG